MKAEIYAVLLAGGRGTRLWPLSADSCPKSFISIAGEKPLISQTIERAKGLVDRKNIVVVADRLHGRLLKKFTKGLPRRNILIEPFGRNTASAIGLAAISLPPEGIMVVLPTDALIKNIGDFRKTLKKAADFVSNTKGILVCVGVKPQGPSTAYGYIKLKTPRARDVYSVEGFIEKPEKKLARRLVKMRDCLWNAGIFVFRVRDFLDAVKKHAPLLYAQLEQIKKDRKNVKGAYAKMKNISVDYQVMEKARNIHCVKARFPWSDLGSWTSIGELSKKDKKGNVVFGKVSLMDTHDSIVYNATKKKLGVIGLKGAVVVAAEGGMLVCDKKSVEKVRKLAG